MTQKWSPTDYQRTAAFVPAIGASILSQLNPQPGERILDLGCGDGVLTLDIAKAGAIVVGVDASSEMVAEARQRGIDARMADARALPFEREFDAGGRLVAEFGGHTNVAAITLAIQAVFAHRGVEALTPWYHPTPDEYRRHLEAKGFAVEQIELIPRPTPLPGGMEHWLRMFCKSQFAQLPPSLVAAAEREIVELLRPALSDSSGQRTADYVRLRLVASLPQAES